MCINFVNWFCIVKIEGSLVCGNLKIIEVLKYIL